MHLLYSAISQTQNFGTPYSTATKDNKAALRTGTSWLDRQNIAGEVADAAAANVPGVPLSNEETAKRIADGMTAKDPKSLTDQTKTLTGMTERAEPIIKTFDSILVSSSYAIHADISLMFYRTSLVWINTTPA